MKTPAELERYLHVQIPLARAMGVRVESHDSGRVELSAPLEPNHNHLGTAFGGSLAAVATLAGYAFVWLAIGDKESHVVIRDSVVRYLRPVRGDLRAVCAPPDDTVLQEFRTRFAATGKARMTLRVEIREGAETAVEFEGTFVAFDAKRSA